MPIHDDLDDRKSPAAFVERCRLDFEATGNPLHAWEAWGMVRATWRGSGPRTFTRTLSEPNAAGERKLRLTWNTPLLERLEIPDWLGDYLDDCAGKLIGVDAKRQPPLSTAGRALGFPGSLAVARKRWGGPFDKRERLALLAVNRMWDEGLSIDDVASKIDARAVKGASRANVWRAVSGAQRFALRLMSDRLREDSGSDTPLSDVVQAYSKLCVARGRKLRARSSQKRRSKTVGRM